MDIIAPGSGQEVHAASAASLDSAGQTDCSDAKTVAANAIGQAPQIRKADFGVTERTHAQ
jgi:hypothetical protein